MNQLTFLAPVIEYFASSPRIFSTKPDIKEGEKILKYQFIDLYTTF